jgi:hypothetical protein
MSHRPSIIQTLYLTGNKRPILHTLGFLSPEFNWMAWALSCLQLKEIYGQVTLYTNKAGKEILIDQLQLPYTKIEVVLDDIDFPPSLWAYPKLYTYSLQLKPFIHVDGDVFIWEKLKEPENDHQLIVQNIEDTDHFYRPVLQRLIAENFLFPETIQQSLSVDAPFSSINAGVIGGTDIDFFKYYTSQAFEFTANNIDKIPTTDQDKLNMVLEQYFFYCLAKQKGLFIKCQIPERITDMAYKDLFNFSEIPYQTRFIHMVGRYKQSVDASILLAKRLRQNYPDQYYHIIAACKSAGIAPYFNYYKDDTSFPTLPKDFSARNVPVNWKELYSAEERQQALIEVTFDHITHLDNSTFKINPYLDVSPLSQISHSEQPHCYVPFSYIMAFKKQECDELDVALMEALQQPKSFKQICSEIKILFDDDEILNAEKERLFIDLIKLKLRNGCTSNIYWATSATFV